LVLGIDRMRSAWMGDRPVQDHAQAWCRAGRRLTTAMTLTMTMVNEIPIRCRPGTTRRCSAPMTTSMIHDQSR